MKESCPQCHNMVVGEFSPSETRKWLTALAKKGGMKAVLTAAASVIPGFGNVAGFVTGTVLDVIYGNDINKVIDYVADLFDDNKVYVYTCPQCGHTWTRKDDEAPSMVSVAENTHAITDNNDIAIYNKIRDIIADKLVLDKDEISISSRLAQDLGADSLDAVELIMECEQEFGITIPDTVTEGIHTVGDICGYVKCNVGNNGENSDTTTLLLSLLGTGSTSSSRGSSSSCTAYTKEEYEYIEELMACMKDGEISNGERRLLDKLRIKLGISPVRASELELSLFEPELTEEEQEYLDVYRECLADGGEISLSERRLLNRLRDKLGLTAECAAKLENL